MYIHTYIHMLTAFEWVRIHGKHSWVCHVRIRYCISAYCSLQTITEEISTTGICTQSVMASCVWEV